MFEKSFSRLFLLQWLVRKRDLVTYPGLWRAVSNTGDFFPAIAALDPRWRSHGSSPGSSLSAASAAGSAPCWLGDKPASNKTSDASGCRDGGGRTPCNADRDEEEIWPRAILMTVCPLPTSRKFRIPQRNKKGKKTHSEEENKRSSVNGCEENRTEENGEFYAAIFRIYSRRPWQSLTVRRVVDRRGFFRRVTRNVLVAA